MDQNNKMAAEPMEIYSNTSLLINVDHYYETEVMRTRLML